VPVRGRYSPFNILALNAKLQHSLLQDIPSSVITGHTGFLDLAGTRALTDKLDFAHTDTYSFAEDSMNSFGLYNTETNAQSQFSLYSGTGNAGDNVWFNIFGKGTMASVDHRERLKMGWKEGDNQYWIYTETQNATPRDLVLFTEGHTDQLKLSTDGTVSMSGTFDPTNITGSFGWLGASEINMEDAAKKFKIIDNTALAFSIREGLLNYYFTVDTSNGTENIIYGNTTTNPWHRFLIKDNIGTAFQVQQGSDLYLLRLLPSVIPRQTLPLSLLAQVLLH